MNTKKVLLINPHQTSQFGFSNAPLGLLYLAGTLKKYNIPVEVIDGYLVGWEGIRKKIDETQPDYVGITSYTPGRHKALQIAQYVKLKYPKTVTILGGAHPTIMWRQILSHYPFVDICVIGEGEQTLLRIITDKELDKIEGIAYKKDGKPHLNPLRKYTEHLDDIPFPAWDLCELEKYPGNDGMSETRGVMIDHKQPRIPIVTSRGCTGSCQFCLTGETKIATINNGDIPIKSIKVGEVVKTYNGTGIVNELFVRESNEIYHIELESGKKLKVTGEHPIYTLNRGWVKAKELNNNDELDEI